VKEVNGNKNREGERRESKKKMFGARMETERRERKNELKEGKMEREERE
jgi:hypothetical protein